MEAPARVRRALKQPDAFETTTFDGLEVFMLKTFPGEQVLKKESVRGLWNPIFNGAVESIDKPDRDKGVARYTSTNRLLMVYMEQEESRLKFARRCAALAAWVGLGRVLLGLDSIGPEELHLPLTGGRYLLTGRDCPDQTGHNDFKVRKNKSPGFFVLVSGSEPVSLLVCPASHTYVDYPMTEKKKILKLLSMDKLEIPKSSVFVGHGYVQHVGSSWHGHHALRYHTYLIPASYDIKNAVAFAYGASFSEQKTSVSGTEVHSGQQTEGKRELVERLHDADDKKEKGDSAESARSVEVPDWTTCASTVPDD